VRWAEAVAGTSYVPLHPDQVEEMLLALLRRLVAAAQPSAAAPHTVGLAVGAALVNQGRGKVRIVALTCGDPDWRPRPASAETSVARTCSWGVLLLPRSERPGGSSADETKALGAARQPPHGDICPGQALV
jgi:hypothetical protein